MFSNVVDDLLSQSKLSPDQCHLAIEGMLSRKVDYADLYFQASQHESWMLEDGIVKEGSFNVERGVGVRAISGEKTGFAYSDDIQIDALMKACTAASSIAPEGGVLNCKTFDEINTNKRYAPLDPLKSLADAEKIALLKTTDAYIRKAAPQASQVIVSLSAVYEHVLIMASDGTFATDIRPLVRLNCSILMEQDGRRERGSAGMGGRYAYDFFSQTEHNKPRYESLADDAIHMANVNMRAQASPAGTMPVVLGNGWPGVLLHEAVGHGLEGDFNRKGSSTFSGQVGKQVAARGVTVVDDGTMVDRRGSLTVDDEGTPSAYNVLIEDGVLKGYMQDKHNAHLMGVKPTGNGRRESYAHLPMPRMTNTYMLGGKHSKDEIISSVEKGIYAPNFAGGQVDITSGKFVFSSAEAYLIENGKITTPIKGATLIGNGPDVMRQISMIGNDLALDKGVGVCGKDGQSVPVGVGQPTLKIDGLTVGGTA